MKSKLLPLLVALLGLLLLSGAAAITQSDEYAWRVQIADLHYTKGQPDAVPVQVFYRSDILNGSTLIGQPSSTPPTLTVDLIATAGKTVTVNGVTYSYGQAFGLMSAMFAQERAAQLAAQPPGTP